MSANETRGFVHSHERVRPHVTLRVPLRFLGRCRELHEVLVEDGECPPRHEQAETDGRVRGPQQQFPPLVAHALAREFAEVLDRSADHAVGGRIHGEPELGCEHRPAEDTERIIAERALIDDAEDSPLEVGAPAAWIEEFARERIFRNGVDGEVAAVGRVGGVYPRIGVHREAAVPGRHLGFAAREGHVNGAWTVAQLEHAERAPDLAWSTTVPHEGTHGVGSKAKHLEVEVCRVAAQETIPHGAADEEGSATGLADPRGDARHSIWKGDHGASIARELTVSRTRQDTDGNDTHMGLNTTLHSRRTRAIVEHAIVPAVTMVGAGLVALFFFTASAPRPSAPSVAQRPRAPEPTLTTLLRPVPHVLPSFTAAPFLPLPSPTASPVPTASPRPAPRHAVAINTISVSQDPYGTESNDLVVSGTSSTTLYVHGTASHNDTCTPIGTSAAYAVELYPAADSSCAESNSCAPVGGVGSVECRAGSDTARFQLRVVLGPASPTGTWVAKVTVRDADGSGVSASASTTFTLSGN